MEDGNRQAGHHQDPQGATKAKVARLGEANPTRSADMAVLEVPSPPPASGRGGEERN